MKSKQTAVEWLLENLVSEPYSEVDFKYNAECWNKAKEMEKEQIEHSYETGARYALISQSDLALIKGKFPNPTEFYNETFKAE